MIVYIILGIAAVVMAAVGYLLGSKSQTEQIKTLTSERDVQKLMPTTIKHRSKPKPNATGRKKPN